MSFSDFPLVVSSAFILGVEVPNVFGRSFIYIMNIKGLRMDPCGTLHLRDLGKDREWEREKTKKKILYLSSEFHQHIQQYCFS